MQSVVQLQVFILHFHAANKNKEINYNFCINRDHCIYFFTFMYMCIRYVILGGVSAAATTPFDVAKTRIMLANKTLLSSELKIPNVLHGVYLENGFRG